MSLIYSAQKKSSGTSLGGVPTSKVGDILISSWSEEDVSISLKDKAKTLTKGTASTFHASFGAIYNSIDWCQFAIEKNLESAPPGTDRLRTAYGSAWLTKLKEVFESLGEAFTKVIITNYDLELIISGNDLEAQIEKLNNAIDDLTVTKRDKGYYDTMKLVEFDKAKKIIVAALNAEVKNDDEVNPDEPVPVPATAKRTRASAKAAVTNAIDSGAEHSPDHDDPVHDVTKDPKIAAELAQLKQDLDVKFGQMYLNNQDEYENAEKKIKKLKRDIAKLEADKEYSSQLSVVVMAIRTAKAALGQKIKENLLKNVKDSNTLLIKMGMDVTLTCANPPVVVTNPWSSCNLSGIFQVLFEEYGNPSMSMFHDSLLHLISFPPADAATADSNALKMMQQIQAMRKQWRNMELFAYMTEDILFTVAFLRLLPQGTEIHKFCNELVNDLIHEEKLAASELDSDKGSVTARRLAILDHLSSKIENVFVGSKGGNTVGGQDSKDKKTGSGTSGGNPKRPFQPKVSPGVELAAVATAEEMTEKNSTPATGPYKGEVTRDMRIHCIDVIQGKRRVMYYLATLVVCDKCSHPDPIMKHERPYCFQGACKRCNMFGHKEKLCRQENDSTGKKL